MTSNTTPNTGPNALSGLSNGDIYKRVAFSMGSCEVLGMVVAAATLVGQDKVLPKQLDRIKNVLADKVIMPHLNIFEPMYDMIMKSKGKEHTAIDKIEEVVHDPEELKRKKSHAISNTIIKYALPAGLGVVSTIPAHMFIDHKLDILQDNTSMYGSIRAYESAVQMGTFAGINTLGNGAVEATVPLGVKILTKLGVNEDTARTSMQFMLRYEASNMLALGAAMWKFSQKLIVKRDSGIC